MDKKESREVWLRGPVPGIPPLLQPVAHALLQAREEITALMDGFPEAHLWDRPAGVASPGFHLQHLSGVLDRLLTYARGQALDRGQLEALAAEGRPEEWSLGGKPEDGWRGDGRPEHGPEEEWPREHANAVPELVERFARQVDKALAQLRDTPEQSLTAPREVGRARIPSTVLGLLVHAAEHTQRHNGQLLVTVKVISGGVR